jgi:hypothetical protein
MALVIYSALAPGYSGPLVLGGRQRPIQNPTMLRYCTQYRSLPVRPTKLHKRGFCKLSTTSMRSDVIRVCQEDGWDAACVPADDGGELRGWSGLRLGELRGSRTHVHNSTQRNRTFTLHVQYKTLILKRWVWTILRLQQRRIDVIPVSGCQSVRNIISAVVHNACCPHDSCQWRSPLP